MPDDLLDTPVSLDPSTLRDWLMTLRAQILTLNVGQESICSSLKDIQDSRTREVLGCPFSPERKGDNGNKTLVRIQFIEDAVVQLKDVPVRLRSLETKADTVAGAVATARIIGIGTAVSIIIAVAKWITG